LPCHVLDVACGSGGPSLSLVEQTGCRLTGIDIEAAGIWQAEREAAVRGLTGRVGFATADCDRRLPFTDESFDVVVCIDALLHIKDRFAALTDWARLLRQGGRLILADAAVLTGTVSIDDLNTRASQGTFLLAPPGLNERAIEEAGFVLQNVENKTQRVAEIASRWHSARARYVDELLKQESLEWFEQRQRFLAMTAELAASGRLSRFFYVAEKRAMP
jgi:2-polyprenyl-3-methyl-5-hydroxy-6-metoxy-1,4-benzoquinol methylase